MQHLFFIASKIFDFLLSPLSWIILLLLIALFTKNKHRKRRCYRWAVDLGSMPLEQFAEQLKQAVSRRGRQDSE